MLKKISIVLGVVALIIVVGVGLLLFRLMGMANDLEGRVSKMAAVDLLKVADGVYQGSAGNFIVSAKVEVEVKRHRIVKITILKQDCGPGYEARGTIENILKAQSPKVDAVTGASSSSRSLMLAVEQALRKGLKGGKS